MTSSLRRYSEMMQFDTFDERFDYLVLGGQMGVATFGFDRHLNQRFYTSREWRDVRREVIVRDEGRDLAVPGYEIASAPLVHHVNPMTVEDVVAHSAWIFDPEFLVTTTTLTHNAIHFGDKSTLPTPFVERTPNDTRLW